MLQDAIDEHNFSNCKDEDDISPFDVRSDLRDNHNNGHIIINKETFANVFKTVDNSSDESSDSEYDSDAPPPKKKRKKNVSYSSNSESD